MIPPGAGNVSPGVPSRWTSRLAIADASDRRSSDPSTVPPGAEVVQCGHSGMDERSSDRPCRGGGRPMGVFDRMAEHGHEQVIFCYDRTTGLKAIIAIHDTALGPARGGTRYKEYQSEEEALDDALRLAKGMSYKFAFTDMPRGGGKGVILRDDAHETTDRRLLLRAYGRFVQLLAGRFGTGPDLGSSSRDMVAIAEQTDYVWAVDSVVGGTGDSTPLTAEGVLAGMRVALEETDGSGELAGRRVAVQGLGGGELGYSQQRLAASVQGVAAAVRVVLRRARAEGRPTAEVADAIAEERIAASARLRAMSPG